MHAAKGSSRNTVPYPCYQSLRLTKRPPYWSDAYSCSIKEDTKRTVAIKLRTPLRGMCALGYHYWGFLVAMAGVATLAFIA